MALSPGESLRQAQRSEEFIKNISDLLVLTGSYKHIDLGSALSSLMDFTGGFPKVCQDY